MFYENVLSTLPGFVADILAKATFLLGGVMFVDLSMRQGSAAMRHRVWATAFVGLLALPIAAWKIAFEPFSITLDRASIGFGRSLGSSTPSLKSSVFSS